MDWYSVGSRCLGPSSFGVGCFSCCFVCFLVSSTKLDVSKTSKTASNRLQKHTGAAFATVKIDYKDLQTSHISNWIQLCIL